MAPWADCVAGNLDRMTWSDTADRPPPPGDGEYLPHKYKYVDKSKLITELLRSDKVCFFVTAPRRMGKSMMLSMAHRLALGQWEAFPPDIPHWTDNPSNVAVIRLNFSHFTCPYDNLAEAQVLFWKFLVNEAKSQHNIKLSTGKHALTLWIGALVERRRRVVVLVDEYDSFVNESALGNRIDYATQLTEVLLRPFFNATKDVVSLVSVIVCGVSGVSLKSLASGANHFHHAFETDPLWSALVGLTVDELKATYGDLLVRSLRSLPDVDAAADADHAVQFVRSIGNGWCLDTEASVELFSPYVVTSWLADPKPAAVAARWTETGKPGALTKLLKARAPELLEDRVITVTDLRSGRAVADYYSPQNVAQLAFHYGYMSVKARSRNDPAGGGDPTVVLTVPNSAVRADIERAVVDTATVDGTIAAKLGDALRKFDFAAFEAGLNALVADFCRAHGRPFANESELHSWGALWVTAVQRLTASPLWTVPEVLVALDSDAVTRPDRATPRIDSTFFWVDGDGKNCCVVIEWGIDKADLKSKRKDTKVLHSFAEQKLRQLEDRLYVERARAWMEKQGKAVAPGCFKAAAAVYCWNKYDVATWQHQCKVVELSGLQ